MNLCVVSKETVSSCATFKQAMRHRTVREQDSPDQTQNFPDTGINSLSLLDFFALCLS